MLNTIRYFAVILSSGRCIVATGTDRDSIWNRIEESLDQSGDTRTSILAIENMVKNF